MHIKMSSTPAPWFNDLLVPVIVCDVMLSVSLLSSPVCESLFLLMTCAAVTTSHVYFGVTVVREMADHFKIHVFSLKKKSESSLSEDKQSLLKDDESKSVSDEPRVEPDAKI